MLTVRKRTHEYNYFLPLDGALFHEVHKYKVPDSYDCLQQTYPEETRAEMLYLLSNTLEFFERGRKKRQQQSQKPQHQQPQQHQQQRPTAIKTTDMPVQMALMTANPSKRHFLGRGTKDQYRPCF